MKTLFAILLATLALGLATSALADNAALIPDEAAPGWTRSEPMLLFVKNDLYGHIDGGAELFHEFGFDELLVQRYAKGESELSLEIYVMSSPESALGIYLTKCGREKHNPAIKTRHTAGRSQFTLLRNKYFIQINNTYGDTTAVPDMVTLANKVIEKIPEGKPVTLLDKLPLDDQPNLVKGSEMLVRGEYGLQPVFTFGPGDMLRLKGEIFGVLADYKDKSGATWTRLIIDYPDSARAQAALSNLEISHDPTLVLEQHSPDRLTFKDFEGKYATAVLRDKRLDIHLHLPHDPSAAPKSK